MGQKLRKQENQMICGNEEEHIESENKMEDTDIGIFAGVKPKPPKSYAEYKYMFASGSESYGSWQKNKKGGGK